MDESTITRRQFAQFVIVGGVGLAFAGCERDVVERLLSPDWWLELYADGRVRMLTKKVEMGQGAHTGLRTLVAEELDVDPRSIDIVQVPSDAKYGQIITGGSYTLAGWQEQMRRAGATARHMLLQAAAAHWKVPFAEVTTADGYLEHAPTGRRAAYRQFVAAAATLVAPAAAAISLKPPASWRYIGKAGPIAHHPDFVAGKARYGIDVRLPDLCFAVLARAPVLGGRLIGFDDNAARGVPGFIEAVALAGNAWPSHDHCRDAVAVAAKDSWAAQRARDALRIDWDLGSRASTDTAAMFEVLERRCSQPGVLSFEQGTVETAAPDAGRRLEVQYRQPYLAHAPLEPPNATARVMDGRIEVWCGNQQQTRMKEAIVLALGAKPQNVVIHAELIGGSFGRRLEIDYGVEAAKLALALGRPVQVLWTREDDIKCGLYRPGSVHRLAAALDDTGRISSLTHRFAAESVFRQQEPTQIAENGADWTLAGPLVAFIYEVPNVRLEHHAVEPMAACSWWRGTYWNNVTVAVECFVDELAQLSGQDPLALRLRHLRSDHKREFIASKDLRIPFHPARMRRVLQVAATAANWSAPPVPGHARGLACGIYDSPECHCAVVVEMTRREGVPVITSATIAVDVGIAVNPQIVKAQVMGGFVMGASVALREQVTWRHGQVEQRGFEDYPIMRMSDCPRIEIVIVPSDEGICGVGEIVTPAAIAAVSNAASRLMRSRIRSWPIL